MTSDNLSALIARLEAATGADRELDVLVHFVVVLETDCDADPKVYADNEFVADHACDALNSASVILPYTASIDAALTLHTGWCHLFHFDDGLKDRAVVGFGDGDPVGEGRGATPALALCIASLRARMTTTAPTGEHTTS